MAKVVLISPPEQHLLMEAGDRPQLGLLYLASSLKNNKHKAVVSDLNHDSYKQLSKKLNKADYIGITTFTPYHNWNINFANHLRQNYPNAKLIAGGPHATVDPKSLENHFDYIVQGEGENAILDIVNEELKIDKFPQIIKKKYEENLDNLPLMENSLDKRKYGMIQDGQKTITMQTSRSCNSICMFCTKGILGPKQRTKSIQRVREEVIILKSMGYDSIYLLDDNFTQDNDRALAISNIFNQFDMSWRASARTDQVDKNLMKRLKSNGMRSISFGLEHIDDEVLKRTMKDNNVENHTRAVQDAKSLGLDVRGSFIVNLPAATEKTVKRSLEWAIENDLDYADFYPLIAYPGAPISVRPEKYDANILNKSYDFFQTGNRTNVHFPNMNPMDTKMLVNYCRKKWQEHKGTLCPWESNKEKEYAGDL